MTYIARSTNAAPTMSSSVKAVTSVSMTSLPSVPPPSTTSSPNTASKPPGLSIAVKAHIGFGVAIAVLTAAALYLYCRRRRHKRSAAKAKDEDSQKDENFEKDETLQHEETNLQQPHRAYAPPADITHPVAELDALPIELPGSPFPELEAIPAGSRSRSRG